MRKKDIKINKKCSLKDKYKFNREELNNRNIKII